VNSLSYAKNLDESGKPQQPNYALRLLAVCPERRAEARSGAALLCSPTGRYKVLDDGKEQKLDSSYLKDGDQSTPTMH
jgi:hypothetical protein